MAEFKAFRVSDGNLLFPDKILITPEKVEFYKAKIIGYERQAILLSNISSVSINQGILFADIVIETKGGGRIVANGFLRRDAKAIKKLLVPV